MIQAVQISAFLGTYIRSTKESASDLTMNTRHYKRHAEGVGINTVYMQCNDLSGACAVLLVCVNAQGGDDSQFPGPPLQL